jgi:2'-5' RNA ligase
MGLSYPRGDWHAYRLRSASRVESPLHAVAKSHESKFSVAFRYAFARARKTIRSAPSGSSPTVLTKRYEAAMESALQSVLPKMLHSVAVDGGEMGIELLSRQMKAAASHKFGSTQVQLPMEVAEQIAAFPIEEDDLTGDKRELDSHITVKYGLLDVAPNEVSAALAGEDPAEATLGKTIVFEGVENGTADAVVIEVHSDCLHRWNKKIEDAVETTESKYDYKPHATIAYVKPGAGKKYAGDSRFEGMNLTFDRVVLTSKDDQRISLPVDGALKAAADFWMKFDAINPSVIQWAKEHAAALIKDITETTRNRIRIAVEELQEEGDWDFYHDRIMAAVGDEARADLIARHETMLAADEGQRLGWEQAKDAGLLSGTERREWIITGDERTCPICMGLAGTYAPLNGTYADGITGPPAHVQCRCTEGIIG